MAKGKLAIGLDIGSTSVKMIQLKETRRRGEVIYSLQNFGMKPLPPEAIVDNALMNSTAIVQAIQELIGELRIKQKETAISVSGHSVIIKKINLPQMTPEELERIKRLIQQMRWRISLRETRRCAWQWHAGPPETL